MTEPAANRSAAGSIIPVLSLVTLGAAFGVWATWLVPVRLGSLEGLSLLITFAGNLGAGLLALWGLRSPRAGLWPFAGWFVGTAVFTLFVGPGGDVVVPGGLPMDPGVVKVGEYDWLAGLVAAAIVLYVGWRRWGTRQRTVGVDPDGLTSRGRRQ